MSRIQWKGIVKVQIPLATTEARPLALAYNVDRSILTYFPVDRELKAKMRGEPKAFFKARVVNTILHIDKPAEWQEW